MRSELKEHLKRDLGSVMSQNTDSLWDGGSEGKKDAFNKQEIT